MKINYLSQEILNIKEIDKLRYTKFLKEKILLDDWANFSFYDFSIDKIHRKKQGCFYTPEWIIRQMVKNSLAFFKNKINLNHIKILEPSCGTGNFIQILVDELQKITNNTYEYILNNNIYAIDINLNATKKCKERLNKIYNVDFKNIICTNALYYNEHQFDLIIGNPPYGNILNKKDKKILNDKYHNIALNFLDHFYNLLTQKGLLYLIVPHSFSRAGQGALLWRNKIIKEKSLYEIIDVGNPFFDISLEQVIIGLTKNENKKVITNSIRYDKPGSIVDYINIFDNPGHTICIYYDDFYSNLKKQNLKYPFNGKRGKDFKNNELQKEKNNNNYWLILGKNIKKGYIMNIRNYDKYVCDSSYLLKEDTVAITQFGINLKAAIIPKNCIASGGTVLISHQNISKEDTVNYLNNKKVNHYLQTYILNGAQLTVHLDGKYIKQIPYTTQLID